MTTSIGDVADRAGVSVATVSRALRGLPNVAEATRQRVLQAASELDYVVNPNASRLAAGHNRTIAAVVPNLTGWYFQTVLAGVQSVLENAGYDMLLYTLPTPASREKFLIELPFRKRVDGLLLIDIPMTDPEQRMLSGLGTPVVSVGQEGAHFPGVFVDNVSASRKATEYLVDIGHRRVGLISGIIRDPMRFQVSRDRRHGWRAALTSRGIDPKPCWEATGDFRMADGIEAIRLLMKADSTLTAVFCASDEMALGALRGLEEMGLNCPDDVAVVGFDDHEVASYIGLTTVAQPMRMLGRTGAEIILAMAQGREISQFPRQLPTSLVVRESTTVVSSVGA